MRMNRVVEGVALVALISVAAFANAGEVYKCKASTGETIYQNLPCPTGAKKIAHGSYDAVPDDPSQLRAAERDHADRQANGAMVVGSPISYGGANGGGAAQGGTPAGYQCAVNGKTWVQPTPCPASSVHADPVTVHGDYGTATGHVLSTVPVEQQAMSKDEVCAKLKSNAPVSERGKSDSAYERNKMRSANGC